MRILTAAIHCPAPGCTRTFIPSWFQRGACSTVCIEAIRRQKGTKVGDVITIPNSMPK